MYLVKINKKTINNLVTCSQYDIEINEDFVVMESNLTIDKITSIMTEYIDHPHDTMAVRTIVDRNGYLKFIYARLENAAGEHIHYTSLESIGKPMESMFLTHYEVLVYKLGKRKLKEHEVDCNE